MPQMSPINWLSLFLIFSLSFLIFCMMNYYSYVPMMPKTDVKKSINFNSFNWKW